MLGGHSSERCEARSGSVAGVLVLPKEDLTLSDAGELAGMRNTDGVGKCLGRCLFAGTHRALVGSVDELLLASF